MKVSQKIYYITWKRGEGYSKELKETEITGVGRINFNTKLEPFKNISKSRLGCKISSSDDHVLYFMSRKDFDIFLEKKKLSSDIVEALRYQNISDLSFEKVKELYRILFT